MIIKIVGIRIFFSDYNGNPFVFFKMKKEMGEIYFIQIIDTAKNILSFIENRV